MKDIYYKSSEGVIINLIQQPYMMLTDTDLFNYQWDEIMVGNTLPFISKMKKKMKSSKFKITISGTSKGEFYNNLEHLTSVFDRDAYLNQMGRLYVGNYYIELFIKASDKPKIFEKQDADVEFTCVTNSDEWVSWQVSEYSGMSLDQIQELAYTATPRVNKNAVSASEFTINDDNTLEVYYGTGGFIDDAYLMFDFSSIYNFTHINGLEIHGSQGGSGPIVVETAQETTTQTVSRIDLTVNEETELEKGDTISLKFTQAINSQFVEIAHYTGSGMLIDRYMATSDTVLSLTDNSYYTLKPLVEDVSVVIARTSLVWTTQETIASTTTTTTIPRLDNITCRYLRIRNTAQGAYGIEGTLSAITEAVASKRDLLTQSFTLDNCNVETYEEDGHNYFKLTKITSGNMTITSDIEDPYLSDIYGVVDTGGATIQAKATEDSDWELIYMLVEGSTMDEEDIDTQYYAIRIITSAETLILKDFQILAYNLPQTMNNSYAPSEAVIRIYGPTNNAYISIGNNTYGADVQIGQDEYLEIDTKAKTVLLFRSDNSYENCFMKRLEDSFNRVPAGLNYITWNGDLTKIEIELEGARSEPKWN